jgi:hypothetical protein
MGQSPSRAQASLDPGHAARQFGELPSIARIARTKDKNNVDAFEESAAIFHLADPENR